MNCDSKILVSGADTVIGAALLRVLRERQFTRIVASLSERPDYIFIAAGRSGGILANQKYPADLCVDNLRIALDLIPEAHRIGVRKLLYLGSSCIYPRHCDQPMRVTSLMAGPLEPTSESYAMAKLAGIQLCQAYRRQYGAPFITAIPADVFGPITKFTAEDLHVIPSLMLKMRDAKERGADHVTLWGSGAPRREFTYADDLADACLHIMRLYNGDSPINIGSGEVTSIREIAGIIREVVGFEGELRWDASRPDGAPAKWLDTEPLRALGWRPRTALQTSLIRVYRALTTEGCPGKSGAASSP